MADFEMIFWIYESILWKPMSGSLEKERDVRNFRHWYYDNLGLRGVEQPKALDLLLKDDEIGNAWNHTAHFYKNMAYTTSLYRSIASTIIVYRSIAFTT